MPIREKMARKPFSSVYLIGSVAGDSGPPVAERMHPEERGARWDEVLEHWKMKKYAGDS